MFRGGAYKPRTSPYAFQGLGQEGLRLLAEAKAETGLPIVTELMDARDVEPILEVADVIQVGARNMQNYPLLAEIGRSGQPGADQARPVGDARGAADGGGVRAQGGQPERDAVRARHPHVRDRLPLHARHHGRAGAQGALAPAGDRRPEPRRRPARPRDCRCRWPRPRRAPTASSSRSTRTPRRRSATGRSSSTRTASREYVEQVERAAAVAGKVSERRLTVQVEARPRLAVVGVGLIGGSIGLAARERARRAGERLRPGAGGAARRRWRAARWTAAASRRPRRWQDADVAFVAAPVGALPAAGRGGAGRGRLGLRGHATSARPSARSSRAVDDPRFIGGHPLAGAETAGVEHARADLFHGATWYLTPTAHDPGHALRAPAPADRRPRRAAGGDRRRHARRA